MYSIEYIHIKCCFKGSIAFSFLSGDGIFQPPGGWSDKSIPPLEKRRFILRLTRDVLDIISRKMEYANDKGYSIGSSSHKSAVVRAFFRPVPQQRYRFEDRSWVPVKRLQAFLVFRIVSLSKNSRTVFHSIIVAVR